MQYSNPRQDATIEDYPLGGNRRGPCVFHLEHHPKRGVRIVRTTFGKPKLGTFGGLAAIVDGDDGRTYILQFAGLFDFITVIRSDLKCERTVWPREADFQELAALIREGQER